LDAQDKHPYRDIGKLPMIPGQYLRTTSGTSDPKTSHVRPEVTLPMKEWPQGQTQKKEQSGLFLEEWKTR